MIKHVSEETKATAVSDYVSGMLVKDICKKNDITKSTMYKYLRERGISIRGCGNRTPSRPTMIGCVRKKLLKDKEKILYLHEIGMPHTKLGKLYECSASTITFFVRDMKKEEAKNDDKKIENNR